MEVEESTSSNLKIKPIAYLIDWKQIDSLIYLLKNTKQVFFDPLKQQYIIDGIIIDAKFFNEVISKSSHLINVIANTQTANKVIVNIDSIKKE
jgi:hypothetical protein